jgi:DNA-binding transcriptional ArsR family regulator
MSSPGKDAGRDRPLDPNLAKALSHPLRQRILERLNVDGDEASPHQLARLLDAPLPNVAYHVRILLELDCIELVRTRQVRGALEHYYRATAHPWLDAEQWAQLPASFRRQILARKLRDIARDAADAGLAGGFDHPGAQIRRTSGGLRRTPVPWIVARPGDLPLSLMTPLDLAAHVTAALRARAGLFPQTIGATGHTQLR